MVYTYRPKGTCSTLMEIGVEDNIVTSLKVTRGCSGNLQGIAKLVQGMPVDEVIDRLAGIKCGPRPTSCPDQLAKALTEMKNKA